MAFVTGLIQGVSMWDEGSGSGTYIWFMMVTLPVGFVLVVIGLLMKIVRIRRS
jgi:TRAP-type C4-dicarboxylate transport system permease small subunit